MVSKIVLARVQLGATASGSANTKARSNMFDSAEEQTFQRVPNVLLTNVNEDTAVSSQPQTLGPQSSVPVP